MLGEGTYLFSFFDLGSGPSHELPRRWAGAATGLITPKLHAPGGSRTRTPITAPRPQRGMSTIPSPARDDLS